MAYKQHFIDWFSGKQGASYWNIVNIGGSNSTGATLVGKDEINGGMIFTSGTGSNNNGYCGFNAKNQFSKSGFVQIAVWRLDPASNGHDWNNVMLGMSSEADDNGQNSAHYQTFRGNTYIKYRTKGGGTGSFIDSSVATDEAFHHTKIVAQSASSYEFSIDHAVQGTVTSNLPQSDLSPFIKCDDSSQVPSVLGINYMECYNT